MTTLDRELAARIRNVLLLLPAPHEEFDVSYVYQHWAPEVTTTRRADHSTRFQTTWAYDAPTTPPHHRPTASNISGFSSTAAGHLDEYSAATAAGLSATIAHPPLPPVCSIIESLRLVEFSPLGTRQTPPHTTLHDASLAGIARWNFVDQQPGFKVSDARAHASGAAQDCLGAHALLALAAREREMLRLARTAAVLSAVAVHPTTAWQVGTTTRLALPAPRQQRSAYEFVRCDVGSMRRLRVTRGVCLPADYPIHIICGSKDVIHSWAVPGLGIKIDCIPGYNSHRRVLFRWRGLYWGQCMEVCGRYHH